MADLIQVGIDVETSDVSRAIKLFDRMKKDLADLELKRRKQVITDKAYNRGLQQMIGSLGKTTGNLNDARSAMMKYNYQMKQATEEQLRFTSVSGKGMRRLEVLAQQAGYQIGDLAVQIQSGTNAAVAFGQQGSQLLGFFGPAGALAGAGLAIATAFIAPFIKAKESLKEFREELEDLTTKVDVAASGAGTEGVLSVNREIASKIKEIYDLQNKTIDLSYADAQVKQAVADAVKAQSENSKELLSTLTADLELLKQKKNQLEIINALAGSEVLEAQNLEDNRERAARERKKNLDEELALLSNMDELARQFYANQIVEEQKLQQIKDKANASAQDQLRLLEQQNAVAERQIVFGKDSREAERLKGQHIVENLRSSLEKKGVDEEIILALIEQQQLLLSNKQILADKVEEAKKLKEALTPVTAGYLLKKGILPPQAAKDFEVVNEAEEDFLSDKRSAHRKRAEEQARKYAKALEEQKKAAEKLRKELEGPMVSAIDGVSNAFGDFIARGLQDFKGFVNQILASFQNMIAQMIATAARNRIMISLGLGGTGFATGAGAAGTTSAFGGSIGTFLGTTGTAAVAGTGFLGGATSALTGGFGNFFNIGANAAAAGGGFGATLGAALPPLLAVVAVIGLFTKKTKLLDSGLRTTVEGFDVAIETFKKTQSSRLFGLLKGKKVTSYEAAGAELADPLVKAIGDMQQSIVDAAGTLGIGADAFENFSYQFKVSLKGLTEEEQLQKINEEITKMGDSFASLTGHFETMNELLAVAQQRYDLETRLLQLQGDATALLARQREREVAATHELNQALLSQIHAIEDAQMAANNAMAGAQSAFALVQRSIEARKKAITDGFNSIMDALQARIKTAQDAVGVSQGILGSLESASGGSGMTRGAGMAYLRSLRGASRITDQKKLDDALQAIADPSQDLYTNFVDYQRDFQDQANLVRELEEKAALQLSTDEKTLLQLQEEATAAQERYNEQMENLDEQLLKAQEQLDALMGIDKSVQSVEEALGALGNAISGAMAAQQAAAKAASEKAAAAGVGSTGKSFSEQYGTGSQYKGYDLAKLSGSGDLLNAAAMLGVGTSGKTGAQIQQEVSNASGMAVRLDNATRSQQFAMGGMFGGGYRMVGERGPEIEATGPSRIFSTKQTAELFRNPELVEEVRSLRAEVAGLRSENRQIQASNSKYVKRNYDINRKWDTEGLPTTRT